MKSIKILACLLFFSTLFPSISVAMDHFIRAGATGANNGSDWTNAWATLPATLVRGDTYYVAEGSYGSYTFSTPQSGTAWIYIKKATASAHGTDTGWNDTFGDGVANFSSWEFTTGYWDIDGVTGGGPGSWENGHGIKITCTPPAKAIRINVAGVHYINIRHVEATASSLGVFTGIVYSFGAFDGVGNSYVNISHCWFHTVYGPIFHIGYNHDWVVEYSKLGDNNPPGSGGSDHSEIFSLLGNDGLTIRYNYLYSWRSTGGIVAINGPSGGTGTQNVCEDVQIYGNIFDQGSGAASWLIAAISDASNWQYARRWKIHNNTFVNVNSSSTGLNAISLATTGEANNEAYNNIFWGNTDTLAFSGVTHDFNWFTGSGAYAETHGFAGGNQNPFINPTGKDFRLAASIAGKILNTPFDKDMIGTFRGSVGVWDVGAYESTLPSSPLIPNPPAVQSIN